MITWIASLNPGLVLAVICALLFIEECGVPLPFAPGDLLLVVCGMAIAAGLNPVLAIPAVLLAVSGGAITGCEIFRRLGKAGAPRLIRRLRLESSSAAANALLERGGWRTILVGRLVPGLRVLTTEAAGLLALSRRTFVAGLLPAAVMYVGLFIGLGWTFGRGATEILGRSSAFMWLPPGLALLTIGLWVVSQNRSLRDLAGRIS